MSQPGFPGANDLGGRAGAGDAEEVVLVCVLDHANVGVRRDDHLRTSPTRLRGIVRVPHRTRGDHHVERSVHLRKPRDEIEGLWRRQRDFEDADAVARIRLGDRLRRFDALLAHDADDLLQRHFLEQLFARHGENDIRLLGAGLSGVGIRRCRLRDAEVSSTDLSEPVIDNQLRTPQPDTRQPHNQHQVS